MTYKSQQGRINTILAIVTQIIIVLSAGLRIPEVKMKKNVEHSNMKFIPICQSPEI